MVRIVADCTSNAYDSGASGIATSFLCFFLALLVVDAVLTVVALRQTMFKDSERMNRLEAQVSVTHVRMMPK